MAGRDIIVVGASAGGVEALGRLVRGLPADLPAAIFVVVHFPPHGTSVLPHILSRAGPLPAAHARDRERIEPGRIYVASPDLHLLVRRGEVRVVRGPRENAARPAIDPLFRSAAAAYGRRVVGVVLSGNLDDGTAGLFAVKARGGVAVVQDPDEAAYPGMPASAIANVAVDRVLPVGEIAAELVRLAHDGTDPGGGDEVPDHMEEEIAAAELDSGPLHSDDHPGAPSGFSCPECHGVLWEVEEGDIVRYRCRVGHAYGMETLLSEQGGMLEAALWTALKALEERASLVRRMERRMQERSQDMLAARYHEQTEDLRRRAELIRRVLLDGVDAEEPDGSEARSASD